MSDRQAYVEYRDERARREPEPYDESPEEFRRIYGARPVGRESRPARGVSKGVLAGIAGLIVAAAAICGLVFAGHSGAAPQNAGAANSSSTSSNSGGDTPSTPSRPSFISGVPTPSWLPQNPVG